MRLVAPLLLLSLALPARAGDDWPYQAECRRWASVPVPAQDTGSAKDCSTTDLYYGDNGKGRGRDYAAARHCAYAARAEALRHPDQPPYGEAFDGSGVLMMLYANGQGVARNIPLAKRFACEYEGAPAEVAGRLEHLDAIASGRDRKPMDLCDDITSGMMGGFCAARDASFAEVTRSERWSALQSGWTSPQRRALDALRKAAGDYFDSASGNEEDMSGTLRGALATDAEEALEIALLADVERFERGQRPREKAGELPAADQALNAVYRKTRAALAASHEDDEALGDYGTIRSEGVRDTQRLWLRYREAWVNFAAARYPDTPADAWRAWLSNVRSKALAAIIGPA